MNSRRYSIAYYSVLHRVVIPIPIKIINDKPINLWEQAWDIFSNIKKSDIKKTYLIIYGLSNKNVFQREKPKLKEVYDLLSDLQTMSKLEINQKYYNGGWYIKLLAKPITIHTMPRIVIQAPRIHFHKLGYF